MSPSCVAVATVLASLAASTSSESTHVPQNVDLFRQDAVNAINRVRAQYGAEPIQLDENLNEAAQRYARSAAQRPSGNGGYGVNGEILYLSGARVVTAEDAVDDWASQLNYYDPANPVFHPGYGQGTQLVWRSARDVGIGVAHCPAGKTTLVVAKFNTGNQDGQFQQNVLLTKAR
jgi:hypothetical protein